MIINVVLDKFHGLTSEIIMSDGTKKNTNHYVLNPEYPYSVGCFRGRVNFIQAHRSTETHQTTFAIHSNLSYPSFFINNVW